MASADARVCQIRANHSPIHSSQFLITFLPCAAFIREELRACTCVRACTPLAPGLVICENDSNEDTAFLLFTAFNGDRETSVHDIYFSPSHDNCHFPPPPPS